MFGILTILSYLLERIAPETSWRNRLFKLLDCLSTDELHRMGFTKGWQECPLWKPYVHSIEDALEEGWAHSSDSINFIAMNDEKLVFVDTATKCEGYDMPRKEPN